MRRRSFRLLPLLVFAGAAATHVVAAELGEARVSSHIGQQLVADIELAMVEDPAAQVTVRLASPEVYNGAGIALPPVLSSLNLSVMRRDGRQFLHVTSLRPVDAEHLHLYLELTDKGQRAVRLATLWLTPDLHPPAPAPMSVPAPAPLAVPAAAPVLVPAPLPARVAAPAPVPVPAERGKPVPPAPVRKPAPPAARATAAPPAACAPRPDEAQACTVLGARNAALREQLGKLEDKVKGLQQALGVAPGAAAASAPHEAGGPKAPGQGAAEHKAEKGKADDTGVAEPKAAEPKAAEPKAAEHPPETPPPEVQPAIKPAVPKPISSIKPLVPHKSKAPPPEEGGAPWGWIGAGVALLAALGGGAAFLRKHRAGARKVAHKVDIPAASGVLDKLRARFAAPTGGPEAAAKNVVEPTME
jgi:hypothetical protein